jgi:cytochrome b-561
MDQISDTQHLVERAPRNGGFDWRKLKEQVLWTWTPRSAKESGEAIVRNVLLHWFPNKVTRESYSWSYSMYLGTIAAALFAILTVTGVILTFFYIPSMERAYWSIKDIEYAVSFGGFLRAVHRWAAHLMVTVVFLHTMRVFLTAAYKKGIAVDSRRPTNWIVGITLLLATLLLSFTGYLLPMDQLAFWAITVGTNIARSVPFVGDGLRFILLGGNSIDQNTLIRFYVLHVILLPLFVALAFAYHMWRIRKDGGLAAVDRLVLKAERKAINPPKTKTYSLLGLTRGTRLANVTSMVMDEDTMVNTSPMLTRRILVVVLLTFVVCAVLSFIAGAPLEQPANASVTPTVAKAPWYFLWLQELVSITTIKIGSFVLDGGLVGGVLIPGVILAVLALWPWIDKSPLDAIGVWFHRARRRQNAIFLVVVFVLVVLIVVGMYMRGPLWHFYWPWEPWPNAQTRF